MRDMLIGWSVKPYEWFIRLRGIAGLHLLKISSQWAFLPYLKIIHQNNEKGEMMIVLCSHEFDTRMQVVDGPTRTPFSDVWDGKIGDERLN